MGNACTQVITPPRKTVIVKKVKQLKNNNEKCEDSNENVYDERINDKSS